MSIGCCRQRWALGWRRRQRGADGEDRWLEELAKVRRVEELTVIQIEGGQRSGRGERSKWQGGKCSLTLPGMTDGARWPEVCSMNWMPPPRAGPRARLDFLPVFLDEQKVLFHNKAAKVWLGTTTTSEASQMPGSCSLSYHSQKQASGF